MRVTIACAISQSSTANSSKLHFAARVIGRKTFPMQRFAEQSNSCVAEHGERVGVLERHLYIERLAFLRIVDPAVLPISAISGLEAADDLQSTYRPVALALIGVELIGPGFA